MKKLGLYLLVGIFAVSCARVPITSIPKLRKIDAQTTDVAQVAVIARFSDSIRLQDDAIILSAKFKGESAQGSTEFALRPNRSIFALENKLKQSGKIVQSYIIPPSEAAKLTQMREEVLALRASGEEMLGSFGFHFSQKKICLKDMRPAVDVTADLWLKTSETGRFVQVLRGADLIEDSKLSEAELQEFLCKN